MASDSAARYRAFSDLVRLPIGGGSELVYAPLARSAHVLAPPALLALLSCRGVATLDQHADRAAAAGLPRGETRAALEALVHGGLLASEDELRSRLTAVADAAPPRPISTLAIPTRDRPALLGEALESFADDAERGGRELRLLVIDQGTGVSEHVQHAAAKLRRVRIDHVGPADVEAFSARLAARSGVDPELVRFALLTPSRGPDGVGRSRNAIVLASAGEMIAMADDDTRAALEAAPGASDRLALTSLHEPSEHWFARSDVEEPPPAYADVCAIHERLLGRLPGDVAREAGGVDLSRASSMFFRRLAPRGGRVLLTHLGARGDAGTGSMLHLLTLAPPSRDRLLASETTYREAFASRHVTRAATRPTIGDGAFCMSMAIGLDARSLLPPFLPVLRNGDGVFGVVLRVAWHDAAIGFLPWTIAHTPPPRAASFDDRFAAIGKLGAADILAELVLASRVEADVADPAASLGSLGRTLVRWGSLPRVDFEEIARLHVLRARARDLALHEELLAAYGAEPSFWARDVQRAIALLREGAIRPDLAWPADLCAALGEPAGRDAMQALVRRYGELLGAWPALWQAAVELRQVGRGLTPER